MRSRLHFPVPLLLVSTLALAGCVTDSSFQAGTTLRSFDNDAFNHDDDQYSSGLAFSHISKPEASFGETTLPDRVAAGLDEHWPFPEEDQRFVIWSLAHRIFTPTDLLATQVVENDLPYSAMAYGTAVAGSQNPNSLNAVSLSIGLVGPWAFGEELQSGIHSVIGSNDPAGWDNQLDNEPLVNLGVDSRRRLLRFGHTEGLGADLLGGLSASAGNLQTQGTIAATVRAGYRVPNNFQMLQPILAEESLGLRAYDSSKRGWSAYLFAGGGFTAIANAIHLDGNSFSNDSHSVNHDHTVLRSTIGIAVRYEKLLTTVSLESATIPWDHPNGLDHERFARFAFSWNF